MPTYTYKCATCEIEFEDLVPLEKYQEPQSCPDCGELSPRSLGAKFPGMVFKGDAWATKNGRIAGQMAARRRKATHKQHALKMDGAVPQLAPNVGGVRTDSWGEAVRLAKDKGKDTTGYEKLARKENKA